MGDNGRLFLPAELVPLYQRTIVPLAATVTPNAFEAEQLTVRKLMCMTGKIPIKTFVVNEFPNRKKIIAFNIIFKLKPKLFLVGAPVFVGVQTGCTSLSHHRGCR